MFIDTHTHLYDEQFNEDRTAMVQRAIDKGVKMMLLPNCDQHTIQGMNALSDEFPLQCYPMIGLHPVYVKEDFRKELDIMKAELATGKYIAIGEIGLDYYWDRSFEAQQLSAFEEQIDWALAADLPIVIHTRDSVQAGIDTIRKKQNGKLKGVFHCFSGTVEEAQQIIDLGFYLGIGGALTFKNSTLKNFIATLPLDKLILETDAPYLAPVPYRGKRNESSYIPLIASYLSTLFQVDETIIADQTTKNALALFHLLPR